MTIPASGQQRIRRPKKASGRYEAAVMLAAAALCAVAVIAAVSGGERASSRPRVLIGEDSPTLASLDTTAGSDRPIYRHSVIPGGVYTPDELRNALVQDAIAATHYQVIDPNAVRAQVVKKDRFAYVSYRKDDQIYWTRNKVKLSEGETILTDGTHEIRARCGNCISETPMLPVAAVEPDSVELDQLVDSDHILTAAIRAALDSPASALSGSAVPGAFGAGPAGGASPYGSGGSPMAGGGAGGVGGGAGGGGAGGAGGGPSFGGPSGSPGGGGGQPGASPSSPGDPGSPGPDRPTSASPFPESPFVPPGTTPWVPPGVELPPGYTPPTGSNPPSGSNPPTGSNTPPGSSTPPGSNTPPGSESDPPKPLAVPEPGMLFLLGGGAAAVLLRKLRSRS